MEKKIKYTRSRKRISEKWTVSKRVEKKKEVSL